MCVVVIVYPVLSIIITIRKLYCENRGENQKTSVYTQQNTVVETMTECGFSFQGVCFNLGIYLWPSHYTNTNQF